MHIEKGFIYHRISFDSRSELYDFIDSFKGLPYSYKLVSQTDDKYIIDFYLKNADIPFGGFEGIIS